jgi:predicted transcriptional regulator
MGYVCRTPAFSGGQRHRLETRFSAMPAPASRCNALFCGLLTAPGPCLTVSDMSNSITIRLDPSLSQLLDRLVEQTGRTRSAIVREALQRQLHLIRFEQLRRQVLPFAEARGYLTDEDVTREVS